MASLSLGGSDAEKTKHAAVAANSAELLFTAAFKGFKFTASGYNSTYVMVKL